MPIQCEVALPPRTSPVAIVSIMAVGPSSGSAKSMAKKHATPRRSSPSSARPRSWSQGKTVAKAAKQIGTTEQTYYRWHKEYGGLKTDQAKRLKELALGPGKRQCRVHNRRRQGRLPDDRLEEVQH